MHIRTLLNVAFPLKGFVYASEALDREAQTLSITIRPDQRSSPLCGACGQPGSVHALQPQRRYMMIPIWGIAVCFLYSLRRVRCQHCSGVHVERVPWSIGGKSPLTTACAHYLASWARHLSWKETARRSRCSWDNVAKSVEWLVDWGLKHRDLSGIESIGVDEIHYTKKKKDANGEKQSTFLTLVYQIDAGRKRLLWTGKGRSKEAFSAFFDSIGSARCEKIRFVCSDMWQAYVSIIAQRLPNAINVLDRFHIVKHLNEAVDKTRRSEVHALKKSGKPAYLKKKRWLFNKRKSNLSNHERRSLRDVLAINLTTVKAYLFKEDFDHLWNYSSPTWAAKFLASWNKDVMRHRSLPHLKTFVKMIRRHEKLILNYFHVKSITGKAISSGVVEGLNNKVKVCIRKSYGFRSDKYREIALFHALGDLPEPISTHRFA